MDMHRVAVYGSLKKGFYNHSLLHTTDEESAYIGIWVTPPAYTMLDLGHYPGILEGGGTPIHTEVYGVSDQTLAMLDELEGVPSHYRRELLETGHFGSVYLYIYNLVTVVTDGIWLPDEQP
jgi:gamma-glutamylaminecyclotransferase